MKLTRNTRWVYATLGWTIGFIAGWTHADTSVMLILLVVYSFLYVILQSILEYFYG